jgi:cytochrome c biogenesis protein CcmG/thiol:disulfide interchange protein DsbE
MGRFPVRRNTIVLCAVVFLFAVFAWAGWANWEFRQQAAARLLADAARGELVAVPGNSSSSASSPGTLEYVSPLQGRTAPAFALNNVSGSKVPLSSYRGKALLINFWATWCAPCKIETPWIIELRNKYASQGFEVLGIDTEGDDLKPDDKVGWSKTKTDVNKFIQEEKIPYPILLDGDSISVYYGGLDELPTSFFVDRKGNVVAAQVGLTSESDLEDKIKKALAE